MTATENATFTEHCQRQGIVPGVILNSTTDASSALVLSVHEAGRYHGAYVRATLHWPAAKTYDIVNDELPEWALAS